MKKVISYLYVFLSIMSSLSSTFLPLRHQACIFFRRTRIIGSLDKDGNLITNRGYALLSSGEKLVKINIGRFIRGKGIDISELSAYILEYIYGENKMMWPGYNYSVVLVLDTSPRIYICATHSGLFEALMDARINGLLSDNTTLVNFDAHHDAYFLRPSWEKRGADAKEFVVSSEGVVLASLLAKLVSGVHWVIPEFLRAEEHPFLDTRYKGGIEGALQELFSQIYTKSKAKKKTIFSLKQEEITLDIFKDKDGILKTATEPDLTPERVIDRIKFPISFIDNDNLRKYEKIVISIDFDWFSVGYPFINDDEGVDEVAHLQVERHRLPLYAKKLVEYINEVVSNGKAEAVFIALEPDYAWPLSENVVYQLLGEILGGILTPH
ncbi:MAG: hypothetical protein AB7E08_00050 [Candidatus Omnitrophota bacterium]